MSALLVAGLGGGLDVVNAALLLMATRAAPGVGVSRSVLGSVRPFAVDGMERHHDRFADSGTWVHSDTVFPAHGRFAEPRVAALLGEPVAYLARCHGAGSRVFDQGRLRGAIDELRRREGCGHVMFVDGGGDSLVLQPSDANAGSETTNPFEGGDAELLQATHGMSNVVQAVVSVGLDICPRGFQNNVALLRERGSYFGRVNLATGEAEEYALQHLIASFAPETYLPPYYALVEGVLARSREQLAPEHKGTYFCSHTATVTYFALRGEYGRRDTLVPWSPEGGVEIKEEHRWCYFFDASGVESLKIELSQTRARQ